MPTLIVTSAEALVALAKFKALQMLLQRGRLAVPDVVRAQVSHLPEPWQTQVGQWLNENQGSKLEITPTEEFEEYRLLLSVKPTARLKNRAELAAGEVLASMIEQGSRDLALLIDSGPKPVFLRPLPSGVRVVTPEDLLG
jgi:hypothetical protein